HTCYVRKHDILYKLFFFQAEDGIRDFHVTGVQTCALPISLTRGQRLIGRGVDFSPTPNPSFPGVFLVAGTMPTLNGNVTLSGSRSEERRVGKEGRAREGQESSILCTRGVEDK